MNCKKCGIEILMPNLYVNYLNYNNAAHCLDCLTIKEKIEIVGATNEYKGYLFNVIDEDILSLGYSFHKDLRIGTEYNNIEDYFNIMKKDYSDRTILFQFKFMTMDYRLFFVYVEDRKEY